MPQCPRNTSYISELGGGAFDQATPNAASLLAAAKGLNRIGTDGNNCVFMN